MRKPLTVGDVRKRLTGWADSEPWPWQPLEIPPRPLEPAQQAPIDVINLACDCIAMPIPGVLWTPQDGHVIDEPGIIHVERCDECDRYPTDEAAARAVAAMFPEWEAVFLEDRKWDIEPDDRGKGYGCYAVRLKPADDNEGPELRCSHCGESDIDKLKYMEDIQNFRELESFDGKHLNVNSHYDVADDGDNPRLLCNTCDKESPIPEDIEIDFT